MAEREKAMRGLKCCITAEGCWNCPYALGHMETADCFPNCIRDALALLKEQEPRVLSGAEVRERPGTFVWVEIRSPHADWSLCLVFGKVYEDTAYPDLVTIREDSGVAWGRRWEDYGAGCWRGIRSGWRCWTSRPTPEQRRDTKWEARDERD